MSIPFKLFKLASWLSLFVANCRAILPAESMGPLPSSAGELSTEDAGFEPAATGKSLLHLASISDDLLAALKSTLRVGYATLPIDHFGDGTLDGKTRFQSRYLVTDAYYRPGGPVFVRDVSPSGVEASFLVFDSPDSDLHQLLERFHGIGIIWEHRYFGDSVPAAISPNSSDSVYKYLTLEQALADVPEFAHSFRLSSHAGIDLTPAGTPWVYVGCAYGGARAAALRNLYPETIYASYASSAPAHTTLSFSSYYDGVAQGMELLGYEGCANDLHRAIMYIDEKLGSPADAAEIKKRFLGPAAVNNSNQAFAEALASVLNSWSTTGVLHSDANMVGRLCEWIRHDPVTGMDAPKDGWASVKDVEYVVGRWSSWPYFAPYVSAMFHTICPKDGDEGSKSPKSALCRLSNKAREFARKPLIWLACNEFGLFPHANIGPRQLVSKYLNLEYFELGCHTTFVDAFLADELPIRPLIDQTNERYGLWGKLPANTYWVDGEVNPARSLGVMSRDPASPQYNITDEIPAANQEPAAGGPVFGSLLSNSLQCSDLQYPSDNPDINHSWLVFGDALERWLRDWKPAGKAHSTKRRNSGAAGGSSSSNSSSNSSSSAPAPMPVSAPISPGVAPPHPPFPYGQPRSDSPDSQPKEQAQSRGSRGTRPRTRTGHQLWRPEAHAHPARPAAI